MAKPEWDRKRLASALRKSIEGDLLEDQNDLSPYATDGSIFSLPPGLVVAPRNEGDLEAIIDLARDFQAPITARGGGTGVAGQSIGSGLVIDFRKHLNRILEVGEDSVVVEPGVVLEELNQVLASQGRAIGPDPSSHLECTLGGMVANNAAGAHSLKYGSTRDQVLDLRVWLPNGWRGSAHALEQEMKPLIAKIRRERDLILASRPETSKNSSGYALWELLADPPNFARFLVGSEGTLALISKIELKSVPIPEKTSLILLAYESVGEAIDEVEGLQSMNPQAIELLDQHILKALGQADPHRIERLGLKDAKASLWVEWSGEVPESVGERDAVVIASPQQIRETWKFRSQSSELIHAQARQRQPLRCIEDAAVPTQELASYVEEVAELLFRNDCDGPIFGHVGDGHLHINPGIDVSQPNLHGRIERLMEQFYEVVLRHRGTISGEHGDGFLRIRYADLQWEKVRGLHRELKTHFDPQNLFNPGKKLNGSQKNWPSFRAFE